MTTNAAVLACAMATALLIAGCDKDKCDPVSQTANAADPFADIRKAAEASIRLSASNPDTVRFRGVHVWPQAIHNQFAACGQVDVFGPTSNTYVLFVTVVTRDDSGQDPATRVKADAHVGSTVTEATKVYLDTLARCFAGGGPQTTRREAAPPVPPMPDDIKAVLAGPPPAAAPPAAAPAPATTQPLPKSAPASGTVVMRQAGNIRASPQGETLRVEPAGKELHVFAEAPGGWLQIGDTEPNGWVHSSLVERR